MYYITIQKIQKWHHLFLNPKIEINLKKTNQCKENFFKLVCTNFQFTSHRLRHHPKNHRRQIRRQIHRHR